MVRSMHFLVQISCFSHRSLKPFANLKHIFRTLKIYVENTHNHLITSEKHSSWPSEHLLHVLFVHFADHLADHFADHFADDSLERLINYLIPSLMIIHLSAQTQMTHVV